VEQLPVAVVGSGPSGLAAAFRLRSAGHAVSVFEAANRVGGRIRTARRDGYVLEQGAGAISSRYTSLLHLVGQAGMESEVERCGTEFGFARDGQIHSIDLDHAVRDGIRTDLLSVGAKLSLAKIVADLWRARRYVVTDDLSVAGALDTETAEAWARRRGLPEETVDQVVDALIRGGSAMSASVVSKVDFFFTLAKFVGARMLTLRDGLDSYPDTLARLFEVRLASQVKAVEESGDGVVVTWSGDSGRTQDEHFAGCILAVPAYEAANIYQGLDAQREAFLRRSTYSSMVNVNVGLRAFPPQVSCAWITVPRSVHPGLILITVDHNAASTRVPEGRGMLTCYTDASWSRLLVDEDDASVTESVLAAVERVIPRVTSQVTFTVVNRWPTFAVISPPGRYQELGTFSRLSRSRDRLVQLAGDYFAPSNLDGASASGDRAAAKLVAALEGIPSSRPSLSP
jgi:oxygen-dependent protoporphyrinogen oxidase